METKRVSVRSVHVVLESFMTGMMEAERGVQKEGW